MEEILSPLADEGGLRRQHDRLQRARRAHGLAAERAAAADQPAAGGARCAGRRSRAEGLRGQGPAGRLAEDELRRTPTIRTTGRATCSSGAPTSWAPAARATSTSSSTCSVPATACRARIWARSEAKPERSALARQGARRQARPAGHARLSHEHDLPVLATSCCRPPPGTRRTISTPATCTRSSIRCPPPWIPAWQSRSDWDIYKGFAKKFSEVCVGHLGVEQRAGADAADARHVRRSWRSRSRCKDWKTRRVRADSGQDRAAT